MVNFEKVSSSSRNCLQSGQDENFLKMLENAIQSNERYFLFAMAKYFINKYKPFVPVNSIFQAKLYFTIHHIHTVSDNKRFDIVTNHKYQ